jgi:aldose 1-epimerase
MTFRHRWERRPNSIGRDDQVAVLDDGQGGCVEIWPAQGFNAYRWRAADGAELLFATDKFFQGDRPTRSGIPVLFPFPNRIRDGRYSWAGKTYQLPTDDPSGKNAIHGFAYNAAWRVVDSGANSASAWVTGEFQLSREAPQALSLWPADARLRLTYRLGRDALTIESVVDNPDRITLPFGLGYHPYFAVWVFGGENAVVQINVQQQWELQENLPTGRVVDLEEAGALAHGKPLSALHLDDLFTGVREQEPLGAVCDSAGRCLVVSASADFREVVAFTPPHRQAVCLEPYTCTTDALNLQARGMDAGLRVLEPGQKWAGKVALSLLKRKEAHAPGQGAPSH